MKKNTHQVPSIIKKKRLILIIGIISIMIFIPISSQTQVIEGNFEFGGLNRNYLVFLPQNYQPNMPVIFNLAGYQCSAQFQMDYTLMNEVADTSSFIVVYPEAVYPGFNSGYGPPLPTDVDDVGFISALIDTINQDYQINTDQVYCCGFSNGAWMTQRLACELGDRFKAYAAVSGLLIDHIYNNCNPADSVPILFCHGTSDALVNFNGGPYPMMLSVEETLNFWLQINNCTTVPDTIYIPDTCLTDSSTVQRITYKDNWEYDRVVLYKIINGGHSWPGTESNINVLWDPEGNRNMDININIEIRDFFFQNYINPFTGIKGIKANMVNVYPNPTSDILNIDLINSGEGNLFFEIFDINGKIISQNELNVNRRQNTYQIDVSGYKEGIYLLRIVLADEVLVSKFILN
jgi:polyhydroxybutyrate depolymerase